MADEYEKVRRVVAKTLPEVHWQIWQDNLCEPDWMGGIDAYAYRGEIHRFGPAPFEAIEEMMIERLGVLKLNPTYVPAALACTEPRQEKEDRDA